VTKTVSSNGLVLSNLSPVEAQVLDLNAQDLWNGQSISVETLFALRSVRQEQALQLLSSLEAKGRRKGIQNPNNYVQAALVRIGKESVSTTAPRSEAVVVPPPCWNYAGNRTRSKAVELGLNLEESALDQLARQPMKEAISILEAAEWVQSQGQDPNEYVCSEVGQLEASVSNASASKDGTTFVKEEYMERAAGHHYEKVQHRDGRRRAKGGHPEKAAKQVRRS